MFPFIISAPEDLPARQGDRPRTSKAAPHSQLDQLPSVADRAAFSSLLAAQISLLPEAVVGGSRRAPPGTTGFHMATNPPPHAERAFLLGAEFAHIHGEDDGSLHTVLPEPLRSDAIEKGWAEPHPFAGMPTVSPDTVMLYAPRNVDEVAIIAALVRHVWMNAKQVVKREV